MVIIAVVLRKLCTVPASTLGDGTRIPLLVISPYVIPGSVDHAYSESRIDSQVHRSQLGAAAAVTTQP